jgi:hypothetical protein
MAESTLSISYTDFKRAVGHHLGYTRDESHWEGSEKDDVDESIRQGLRRVYWPILPGENQPIHQWSFLRPVLTVTLVINDFDYDLPDNFAGLISPLTLAAGSATEHIEVIPEPMLRALKAADDTAGTPRYAAVRPRDTGSNVGQRFELLFYPKPSAIGTVTYRAAILPQMLTDAAPYPLGGMQHAETFLASIIASAELFKNDPPDPSFERDFQTRLAASIAFDRQHTEPHTEITWPVESDPTTLDLRYQDLLRQVGKIRFDNFDPGTWSHQQRKEANFLVQAGLNAVYHPPRTSQEEEPYQWSFLRPLRTLALVGGTDTYNMPDDFAGIPTTFSWLAGSAKRTIQVIDEDQMRALKAQDNQIGTPVYVCFRQRDTAGAARQKFEVLFYPTPAANDTLSYRGVIDAPALNATTSVYPLGGAVHALTFLESCRYQAELAAEVENPRHLQSFLERLRASIAFDARNAVTAEIWPVEEEPVTSKLSYNQILRQVGHLLGFGWNNLGWTYDQLRTADFIVQRAVQEFYQAYKWRFLEPRGELTIESGKDDYDLPDNFGALEGDLYYRDTSNIHRSIKVVGESDIEALRSQTRTSVPSWPVYAAVRPKPPTTAGQQTFDLMFWPTPTIAHSVTYRYRVQMGPLSAINPYPLGGVDHAGTLLECCLAYVEKYTQSRDATHRNEYQRLLELSKERDKELAEPEFLGWMHSPDWRYDYPILPYNRMLDRYEATNVNYTP